MLEVVHCGAFGALWCIVVHFCALWCIVVQFCALWVILCNAPASADIIHGPHHNMHGPSGEW